MSAIVKFVKETYGKESIWGAIKAGGWKLLIDGNPMQTTIIHSPGGTYVGSDDLGNKYYERPEAQYGRHRWVVYANLDWPDGYEPTQVPAEWHGWLYNAHDSPPSRVPVKQPIFRIQPGPGVRNLTGTDMAYMPKGHWRNPKRRNWKKMQFWEPSDMSFEQGSAAKGSRD